MLLIRELVKERRRFTKPQRYDARAAAPFPNVQLVDIGPTTVALHVLNACMSPADRQAKQQVVSTSGAWARKSDHEMPSFPTAASAG